METHELLNRLETIVDEAKTAILATVDSAGCTHMRWMTPAVLKHRPGAIFTFSAPDAPKVEQVHAAGCAEWMFQTRDLRQIINVAGPARVLDNPALKSELMEILGPRLIVFWKANLNADEFVVIETVIEEATFFEPMKGTRQTVHFD